MTKEKYIEVVNDRPRYSDFVAQHCFLCGIEWCAAKDPEMKVEEFESLLDYIAKIRLECCAKS